MTHLRPIGLAALLLTTAALADEKPASAADPMSAWKPTAVVREKKDREELQALMDRMQETATKGDLQAAAALVDFPVLMVTDDPRGEASGEVWTREQWLETMRPFYDKPMPAGTTVQGKPTIVLVSDSLALVAAPWTMKMDGKKVQGTSGLVAIRKGGEWKAKSFVEGGWGDLPAAGSAPAK